MTEEERIGLLRKLAKRFPYWLNPETLESLIAEGKTADEIRAWIHAKQEWRNQMMKEDIEDEEI